MLTELFNAFRSPPASIAQKPERPDAHDIAKAVRSHCRVIGCNDSNTIAAVAWALKDPGHTLAAVRAGNKRADQLRGRQAAPAGLIA